MRVYMDLDMVMELELTYFGKVGDERVTMTPNELLKLRGVWKGYDERHMDYFREVGMNTPMLLVNTGLGWFEAY
mgnify:CR=1 FL=1